MSPISLGLRYFAGIFVTGVAFGTLRTLWLVPEVGELVALRLELPLRLVVSVVWCRYLLDGRTLGTAPRALIGGSALVWLLLAEFGLALGMGLGPGLSPQAWAARLATPAGLLGLTGQLVFAAMPLLQGGHRP